ncbi:MAG: hypothetical protein JWM33_568 [Caulobacteraceae bacterium]|nr:hypothetical protein [Caulobacteraceae bacterium]
MALTSARRRRGDRPISYSVTVIAAGVPLMVNEGPAYRSFRIGLFGLDKLTDIPASVARLETALDQLGIGRVEGLERR